MHAVQSTVSLVISNEKPMTRAAGYIMLVCIQLVTLNWTKIRLCSLHCADQAVFMNGVCLLKIIFMPITQNSLIALRVTIRFFIE